MVDDDCSCRVIVDFTAHPLLLHLCFAFTSSTHHPYPGAAGARELAHRAPGAIIIGGGCEFVLEFLETYLTA